MIVDCPIMEPYRKLCEIGPFVRLYKTMNRHYTSVKIYAMYLDDRDHKAVQRKSLALYSMKIGWHRLMNIPLMR